MAVGLTLPNRYIWDQWLSMLLILLAGMSLMWVVSAALVEALVPGMDFVSAFPFSHPIHPLIDMQKLIYLLLSWLH